SATRLSEVKRCSSASASRNQRCRPGSRFNSVCSCSVMCSMPPVAVTTISTTPPASSTKALTNRSRMIRRSPTVNSMRRSSSLPALPLGTPVFHSLPGRALVLPALAPAVGDGIVVPRLGESAGVLLIRGGEIVECFCIDGGETITGDAALQRMTRWGDASVSATQLSVAEASLISQLFHGEPVYEDLRLGWVDWS